MIYHSPFSIFSMLLLFSLLLLALLPTQMMTCESGAGQAAKVRTAEAWKTWRDKQFVDQ